MPNRNEHDTALLWWRGTYTTAQRFDAAVVGLVDRASETNRPMQYVDASPANTSLTDGSALNATGPDTERCAADDRWHWRSGYGNDGSVLVSSELDGDDTPVLRTIADVRNKHVRESTQMLARFISFTA